MKLVYQGIENELQINPRATIFLLLLKFLVYLFLVVFFYLLIYTTDQPVIFFVAYTAYGLSAVLFGFNYAHD